MAPLLSIIIPHKKTPMNDLALEINVDTILHNTVNSFELIIDIESPKDPYKIWNECSIMARGKILVFTNSDVIMAPGWDEMFVKYMQDNAILVGYLVEPGNIGVAVENIHMSFGRDPLTFNRMAFENWAFEQTTPECKNERGWYMPSAFYKDWFNWTGGFDTTDGFPSPNDIKFWNRCTENFGTKLLRVRSYAYHFQNLSGRPS